MTRWIWGRWLPIAALAWLWIGGALGLACLTRGNLILFVPVLALWVGLRRDAGSRIGRSRAALREAIWELPLPFVVLGGIYETERRDSVTKVPWLGDLPGVGGLFRSTSDGTGTGEQRRQQQPHHGHRDHADGPGLPVRRVGSRSVRRGRPQDLEPAPWESPGSRISAPGLCSALSTPHSAVSASGSPAARRPGAVGRIDGRLPC